MLLLLDEVEKAHPEVLKLFLQVMDAGYMTNAVGEKISFKNVVLFMTSNIGCDIKSVGFKSNNNLADNNIRKYFGEEFVNRIDKHCCCSRSTSFLTIRAISIITKCSHLRYKCTI